MASNDCLPYKTLSYLDAVVAGTVSVATGVLTVTEGVASEEVGATSGAASVVAALSEVSLPLLQAATDTAIANTKKSFFMFSVFFEFCLNKLIRHLYRIS